MNMLKATKPMQPIANAIYMMLGTAGGTGYWYYQNKHHPPVLKYANLWAVKGPDMINHTIVGTSVGYIVRFAPIPALFAFSLGCFGLVGMEMIERNKILREKYGYDIMKINIEDLTKAIWNK
jgi:hypothetical protein